MLNRLKQELEEILVQEAKNIKLSEVWADEIHSIIQSVMPIDLGRYGHDDLFEILNDHAEEWFDNN